MIIIIIVATPLNATPSPWRVEPSRGRPEFFHPVF